MATRKAKYFCENCGSEVVSNARFCPKCGKFFSSVRCPKCGFTGDVHTFKNGCPECGYAMPLSPTPDSITQPDKKNKPNKKSKKLVNEDAPTWVFVICIVCLAVILFFIFMQIQSSSL